VKGEPKFEVKELSKRGGQLAEIILLCVGTLGREANIRETLAHVCCGYILKTILMTVVDDPSATVNGLRALYNCCYRSEQGQSYVKECRFRDMSPIGGKMISIHVDFILESVRESTSWGDVDVRREYRRLELALQPDGWRGGVEEQMTKDWESEMIAST